MVRLLAAALLALSLAGCGGADKPSAPGEVVELTNVATLKTAFAEDTGKPRVLLLLSPT